MNRMAGVERTQRALLDAGRIEFARYGLAGARTDRIATTAGVNKQRIYAYFGNKDGMFRAVLADALHSLLELVPFPDPRLSPGDFLSDYVERVSEYHRAHPELLRLLQWEALELGATAVTDAERAQTYRHKVRTFGEAMAMAEDEAAALLFGVIGLAAWPTMVPQLGDLLFGEDDTVSRTRSAEWARDAARRLAPTTEA